MDLSHIDAIIFDSDGVLVDSEVIHIAAERDILSSLGLTYDYETYMSRFVGLANDDFYAQLAADLMAETGQVFPSDFDEQLHNLAWPRIEAELQPVEGVAELVKRFEGPVAVGSSARAHKLNRKLEIAGLHGLFDPHIYSADYVEKGKPAPDLFLHAAIKLQIQPARCLVIEDSINGVKAAIAAGMTPIGFTGGGHADEGLGTRLKEAGAATVCDSHAQIASILVS